MDHRTTDAVTERGAPELQEQLTNPEARVLARSSPPDATETRDGLWPTASAIASWVEGHVDLLEGLVVLRALGTEANQAVESVLAVREVLRVRLSVELFEALARGSGSDPEELLRQATSPNHVDLLDAALFGQRLRVVAAGESTR